MFDKKKSKQIKRDRMFDKWKILGEWTLGRWEVQESQGELDVGQEKILKE